MSALLGSGSGIKAGTVEAFAGDIPAGWLECNGAAISRAAYAKLFLAIGETYGAGDGAATFNLPDLRGEFIRGLDAGRGVDAGRAVGSFQGDQMQQHNHNLNLARRWGSGNSGGQGWCNDGQSAGTANIGTTGVGGAENRPRNVAMRYGIKY